MWYYSIYDQHEGPVSEEELKALLEAQKITPQSLVWREDMRDWLPLEQTELAAKFALPLPEGDAWEVCAFTGEKMRRSEMVQLDGCWVGVVHKDEAVEYLHQGNRLPKAELNSNPTGSLELGHLMRSSWALLRACQWPACMIYLLVEIPSTMLSLTSHSPSSFWFNLFSPILLTLLSNGGVLYLFSRQSRGQPSTLGQAAAAAFSNWGRLFVVMFVTIILTLLGCFFLIIPGLLILVRLLLANVAAVDGKLSGTTAVQASWDITEGHFWRTFGYLMLISLICGWPPQVFNEVARQVPFLQNWLVMGVVTPLLQLPSIYMQAFFFRYYKELQARQRMATRHST